MPSKLRSETARLNGAKSRGPVTPAGLEKSSQNAIKHGLTSQSAIVLACEAQSEFDELLNHFMLTYQPANPAEKDLVEEMVACRWRIRRLWGIETSLLDSEFLHQKAHFEGTDRYHLAKSFRHVADNSHALSLSLRYQSQLHRTYDRAFAALRSLQQSRPVAVQSEPLPEAPATTENASVAKGTQDPIKPPENSTMPSNPSDVLATAPVQPEPSRPRSLGNVRQIDARPDDDPPDMPKWA